MTSNDTSGDSLNSNFRVFRIGCAIALAIGIWNIPLLAEDNKAGPTTEKQVNPVKSMPVPFDLESLSHAPAEFPADDLQVEGVKAFFYEGLQYKGQPTRIFAYYGTPKSTGEADSKKVPAVVLIHGGGGTAFDRWVKLWNSRGYAAIAMDLCGCVPVGEYGRWKRHERGGPPGWDASFGQLDDPIQEQWTYQAVAAVALANSLLRSYPEVDPDRIGVTGISWGGYLTCVVAGVDSRFQFASPVYGCGFLGENSAWLPAFEKMGPERAGLWLQQWDPSQYLPQAKMPMLWVNGTNDFAYPMDSWKKSYRLPPGHRTLCLRVRMPHGHGPAGENPAEIEVFANSLLRQSPPLAHFTAQGETENEVWAEYKSDVAIVKAELEYTLDAGRWQERKWEQIPAELDSARHQIRAQVPADAKAYYLNLFDDRDCVVSIEHIER